MRAGGLYIRTIEALDQRGIADRFVSQGQMIRCAPFAGTTLDTGDLLTRHNYFLALWQTHTERILADWVGELDVPIYRGREVTGFTRCSGKINYTLDGLLIDKTWPGNALRHGIANIGPISVGERYTQAAKQAGYPERLIAIAEVGHFEIASPLSTTCLP